MIKKACFWEHLSLTATAIFAFIAAVTTFYLLRGNEGSAKTFLTFQMAVIIVLIPVSFFAFELAIRHNRSEGEEEGRKRWEGLTIRPRHREEHFSFMWEEFSFVWTMVHGDFRFLFILYSDQDDPVGFRLSSQDKVPDLSGEETVMIKLVRSSDGINSQIPLIEAKVGSFSFQSRIATSPHLP